MTDVHYTWFGPPASADRMVKNALERPDLFGLQSLHKANARPASPSAERFATSGSSSHSNQNRPNLIFWCLAAHTTTYRKTLSTDIEVRTIESALEEHRGFDVNTKTLLLPRPTLSPNYANRVGDAIKGMLASCGDSWRTGAFMKDLWSLYCVWKFGGYHLDSGCCPLEGAEVNLPEPTMFRVVADPGTGTRYPHRKVKFSSGKEFCATLSMGNRALFGEVLDGSEANNCFKGLIPRSNDLPSLLNRRVDVGLLCSPAGDPVAQAAIEFYLQGCSAIRGKQKLTPTLLSDAFRELIISSVATAITHAGAGRIFSQGCVGYGPAAHLINMSAKGEIVSLGIRKQSFQTHH